MPAAGTRVSARYLLDWTCRYISNVKWILSFKTTEASRKYYHIKKDFLLKNNKGLKQLGSIILTAAIIHVALQILFFRCGMLTLSPRYELEIN